MHADQLGQLPAGCRLSGIVDSGRGKFNAALVAATARRRGEPIGGHPDDDSCMEPLCGWSLSIASAIFRLSHRLETLPEIHPDGDSPCRQQQKTYILNPIGSTIDRLDYSWLSGV
jgi:hypothetical protein